MIDIKKKYTTRDGLEVRIYCVDGYGAEPVHGAVFENNIWELTSWTALGKFYVSDMCSEYDLVEVKEKGKGLFFVNVRKDSVSAYQSLMSAKLCSSDCISVGVPVEFEYEVGYGLEKK